MSTQFIPENVEPAAYWDCRSENGYIEFKIRPRTALAIIVSLLLHGVLLFSFSPDLRVKASPNANSFPKSISVHLAGLPDKKTLKIAQPVKQKRSAPEVIAVEQASPVTAPVPTFKIPLNEDSTPAKDFMSFVRAKQRRVQEQEDYAARENSRTPSAEELRDENIRRNLQQPGTSGIFEIRRRTSSTAQFSFKGWKNKGDIPRLELIDVVAAADGDINLAVVKKMIDIIRREYKGDFNWESQRLGQVVVLSARMNDNAGLEDFLKREFFSQQNY